MKSMTFRNKDTQKTKELENVIFISNRDGSYMIICNDNPYPEFLDSTIWELWRFQ